MMRTDKGARTKARVVESMLELLQAHGYSGTGLNSVTEHAGAPKGSLYFHFPGGKEALGEQAVGLAAEQFRVLIEETALVSEGPGRTLRRIIEVLAGMLADSDFRMGCPVSIVTLEMGAESERLREACVAAFDSWISAVEEHLIANGHPGTRARALATTVVSTVEGAVIVSRAHRSVEPLQSAASVLADLVDAAVPGAEGEVEGPGPAGSRSVARQDDGRRR